MTHAARRSAWTVTMVALALLGSSAMSRAAEPGAETFVIGHRLGSDVRDLYADTHRDLDRLLLPRVLERTGGNLRQAALLLGIARQTLRLKLRDLGLAITRRLEAEEEDAA